MSNSTPTLAGVVIDVDGTATDTERVWREVERETLEARGGPPLSWQGAVGFKGLAVGKTAALIAERCKLPSGLVPEIVAELEERFEAALESGTVHAFAGVPELLDSLASRGIPVAAVSNSPRRLVELTLQGARLSDFLSLIVCADDNPALNPKPQPDLYTTAAAQLGIDPLLSWGLEDSPTGLLSLHAANFLPLAVDPEAVPTPGVYLATRQFWPLDVDWLFTVAASRQLPRP